MTTQELAAAILKALLSSDADACMSDESRLDDIVIDGRFNLLSVATELQAKIDAEVKS